MANKTFRQVLEHLKTLDDKTLDEEFRIRTNEIILEDNRIVEEHLLEDKDKIDKDNIYVSIVNINNENELIPICNMFDGILTT